MADYTRQKHLTMAFQLNPMANVRGLFLVYVCVTAVIDNHEFSDR